MRSWNNPQKGVILYLKFLLHFWSYNNSQKITVWCFLREHGEHLDSTGSCSTGVCHAFHIFPLSPSSLFKILDSNLNWFHFCFQLLFIKCDYHEKASILKSSIRFYSLYLWIFIAAIHCFFYFILFYNRLVLWQVFKGSWESLAQRKGEGKRSVSDD